MKSFPRHCNVFLKALASRHLPGGCQTKKICLNLSTVLTYSTESKSYASRIENLKQIRSAESLPSTSTHDPSIISVTWSDGTKSNFSSLHLRDGCKCSKCYDGSSLQRLLPLYHEIPLNIEPKEVWTCEDVLNVTWEDGHSSSFNKERLVRMHSSPNKTNIYHDRNDTEVWKSGFNIHHYDYNVLMNDDSALIEFLWRLKSFGLTLVQGVPCKEGQLREFVNRFAKLRNTHYMDLFTVKSKPNPNNLAYTNQELKLHIDLPFYTEIPSVQLLHCLKQSEEGGSNTFVDGLNCAHHLKEADPKAFETLTTYKWPYRDIAWENGRMHYLQARRPVIEINSYGKIDKIAYNNHVRDEIGGSDPKKIFELYRAWYAFSKILHDETFTVEYLLKEGDLVIFDNGRVLHGRRAFLTNQTSTARHYEGGYIEWDDILSSLRLLNKNYHRD